MKRLGATAPDAPLDRALYNLKKHNFNEVLGIAFNVAVDPNVDLRERIMGRLLAARIYLYANLIKQLGTKFL